jgi:hypothetical protein
MTKVATLVQVLKQKWPAKEEDEIKLAGRKIVAEMGLVPSSPPTQGGGQTR